MTRYMDKRYDEVADLQARAWKKVKTDPNFSDVEDTAEWKWARALADEIQADQEKESVAD